jgi:hypothetical protein
MSVALAFGVQGHGNVGATHGGQGARGSHVNVAVAAFVEDSEPIFDPGRHERAQDCIEGNGSYRLIGTGSNVEMDYFKLYHVGCCCRLNRRQRLLRRLPLSIRARRSRPNVWPRAATAPLMLAKATRRFLGWTKTELCGLIGSLDWQGKLGFDHIGLESRIILMSP